jgi:NAD(P)-dependent dehydrogenase (short-subunit alcohol dehydrogenase family)
MTGKLDGRIAIVTGAGRGIGREHALLFAREGAKVVVNDLGGGTDGAGSDATAAEQVVAEIEADGGEAVANHDDVADASGAASLVQQTIDTFGDVHVLVNNAGILRDRMVFSMTEAEWDDVVRVHLRGHFLPTKFAAIHWREQAKAGTDVNASVINTTSTSGLLSNPGQTNYGAAKSGIATFTEIAQKELGRYGVRVNAIAPAARTRLTMTVPGAEERYAERAARQQAEGSAFDKSDPANISPFVAYLATADCKIGGKVFFVWANEVRLFQPWTIVDTVSTDGRWTIEGLETAAAKWADVNFDQSLGIS